MLQLRELHLQLAFVAARTLREDVQNQADTIDYAARELFLEVTLLARRQLVIEDHDGGLVCGYGGGELAHFSLAGEGGGIGTLAATLYEPGNRQAATCGELFQLVDAGGLIRLAEVEIDQQRAIAAMRAFEHRPLSGDVRLRTKGGNRMWGLKSHPAERSAAANPRPQGYGWRRRPGRPSAQLSEE
jgi:hypothetical protein